MTYITGQPIAASDYMGFRGVNAPDTAYINSSVATDAVAALVGVGYGSRGYGQTTTIIPQVTTGQVILASQWNYLYAAMAIINIHTGSGLSLPVNVSAGQIIQAQNGGSLPNLPALVATLDVNRLTYSIGQMAVTAELTSVLTTVWPAPSVTHEFTATVGTENAARYFFNTGGTIYMSASRIGGSATELNTAMSSLLTQMGTITIGATTTSYTGSGGTVYPIGYYSLTTTYQTVFTHYGSDFGYTAISYSIQARVENIAGVNGGNGTIIRLRAIFSTGAAYGYYTSLDGTLTSTIQQLSTDVLTITVPNYVTTVPL